MGTLTCTACRMTVESEGIDDNPNWLCAVCEKGAPVPVSTPLEIPRIMTPSPMKAPSNPKMPCPSCGYAMMLRKGDLTAKFQCPSCRQKLHYDSDGNVQVYDEFKEFLKKRATEKKATTAKRPAAAPAVKPEPEAESEEEAERTPAGLIYAFVIFPFLAAFGLTFWPEAWAAVQGWLKPALKTLGLS